jgi:hypothetical protein
MTETHVGRTAPLDIVDEWIQANPRRESFVDIGGIGEFSTNERTTWAKRCGYSRVAMADLEDFSHKLWKHYFDELESKDITGIEYIPNVNIDDNNLVNNIGKWDFVHSTGILYHVPNPVHSIANYKRITSSDLIINNVVIPTKIENEIGTLEFNQATALFLPSLVGRDRDILQLYYKQKFGWELNVLAPSVEQAGALSQPHVHADGSLSYYPYWWLFTAHAFESAARLLGLEIVDTWTWENHAHFMWLRVKS